MASPASDTTPQDAVQDVQVSFDLDTERVYSDKRKFTVRMKNREGTERIVTLIDPQDMDYKILLEIEKPRQFLAASMSPEDRQFMRTVDMNAGTLGRLIDAFTRHYGLDGLGNVGGSLF